MKLPDFSIETPLWQDGFSIIGIDEVGRGAFAGPVGIGGVMFSSQLKPAQKEKLLTLGINDSKKLSKKKREELSLFIRDMAEWSDVCFVGVERINDIGIGKATFEGMRTVVEKIASSSSTRNDGIVSVFAIVDGFEIPSLKLPQMGIVRGDSLSLSIAAASIIAKVERDRFMEELALECAGYGFEQHKGYGTLFHRNALQNLGISFHHRRDFVARYI